MNRRSGAFLLALALLTIGAPLAAWLWAPPDALIGYCGVARGEFENWAWTDWWLPRYIAGQAALHGGTGQAWLRAVLYAPRDLDCGNYLDGWLVTQPLKALLGPVNGHNARVVVILMLNGIAAFLACREAARVGWAERTQTDGSGPPPPDINGAGPLQPGTEGTGPPPPDNAGTGPPHPDSEGSWLLQRDAAALVGAVLIACNPITLWDVAESRFAQALIAPAVGYVACLLRWSRTPTPAAAAASGLMLAVAAITYWFMAIFLAPLALLVVACRPRAWRSWALHLAVAACVAAPFAWPFVYASTPRPALGTPFPPYESLAIPAPGVLGPPGPGLVVAQSVDLATPLQPPLGPALPWPWIACAIASLVACAGRSRPFALLAGCAVLWWLLSLGPFVRLHGQVVADCPVYAWAYRWVPFMWRLNWPARTLPLVAVAAALLCVPAMAGLLQREVRRLDPRRRRWALPAASAGLATLLLSSTVATAAMPLPVTPLLVPGPYRDGVLGDARDGVIELTLPLNSAPAAWYQSWHGHPLLGGQAFTPTEAGRLPSWARDPQQVQRGPLFTWAVARQEGLDGDAWPAREAARLAEAGFSWLVVQRTYGGVPIRGARQVAEALSQALGPPVIDVPEMCAWRLGPTP